MWVRIIDSGQELDMHETPIPGGGLGALQLIALGHAVKIDTPTPRKEAPASAVPFVRDQRVVTALTSDGDIKKIAARLAYDNVGSAAGLANVYEHILKLERRNAALEIQHEQLAADVRSLWQRFNEVKGGKK